MGEIQVTQEDEICNMENCSISECMDKNVIIILITFLRSLKIREVLVKLG